MSFCWVGIRKSDIEGIALIKKSIVIFGETSSETVSYCKQFGRRINHNIPNSELDAFFIGQITDYIAANPCGKLVFYNPIKAFEYGKEISSHTLCLNDETLLLRLHDKIDTREWLSHHVEVIPSVTMLGADCNCTKFHKTFGGYEKFVIQRSRGSGGFGTYVIDERDEHLIHLYDNEDLLISPYLIPSIPLNVHLIIYEKEVSLLQPSVQLIQINRDNNPLYCGADFAAYGQLDASIQRKVSDMAMAVGVQLQRYGYRGVAGVDFLLYRGTVFFVEVNPRYQASSALLNRHLLEHGFPSIQELSISAFENPLTSTSIPHSNVPYSNYIYSDEMFTNHMINVYKEGSGISIDFDGYENCSTEQDAYRIRVNYPRNIASINATGGLNVHDNIAGCAEITESPLSSGYKLRVKTELLNQGVSVSAQAFEFVSAERAMREAVFEALDITIFGTLNVNCPYQTFFSNLSPYCIDYNEKNGLFVKRYKTFISSVEIDRAETCLDNITSSGVKYRTIATFSTDRIRINHASVCCFKQAGRSCLFCNLPVTNTIYSLDDIFQTIDYCLEHLQFRHFLIGGGSQETVRERHAVVEIAKYIKAKSDKSVYAMCLPPEDMQAVHDYFHAGVDEIAFNIELFNRDIAKRSMPGKGEISLPAYYRALEEAVKLWGSGGNVRSILIAGLEPIHSLLNGIHKLCTIGVQPVLSIFRPLQNTRYEHMIPMHSEELITLYEEAQDICRAFGQRLGPSCLRCQNNTLSYPFEG